MSEYISFRPHQIDGNVKIGSVIVDKVVNITENGTIVTKKVILPKIKRVRKKT